MTTAVDTATAQTTEATTIPVTLRERIPDTTQGSYAGVPATIIKVGTEVLNEQRWCASPNQEYVFIFQADGNLVQYQVIGAPGPLNPGVTFNGKALWSSGTINPKRGRKFVVQNDGNLVIYDENQKDVWSSNTAGTPGGLYVQDDSNIVLYKLVYSWATIRP